MTYSLLKRQPSIPDFFKHDWIWPDDIFGLTDRLASYQSTNPLTRISKNSSGDKIKIEVLCPGFTKEELAVDVSKNHVSVEGKKEQTENASDYTLIKGYNDNQMFSIKEHLRANLNPEDVEAKLENGILTIIVGVQAKQYKGVKIDIK